MTTPTDASAPRTFRGPWWYTVGGVLFTELMLALIWVTLLSSLGASQAVMATIAIGALVWIASTIPLLKQYRDFQEFDAQPPRWQTWVPLAIAVTFGVLAGILSGLWLIAVVPIAQSLVLLSWPPGVRGKIVLLLMGIIAVCWYLDSRGDVPGFESEHWTPWWMLGFFSFIFPPLTVMSLWWWDSLVRMDRARIAEARLAATQERLRVATDVHDLQGHHLQVIALQLELADRLLQAGDTDTADESPPTTPRLTSDPASLRSAWAQLQLARASVDAARQGTRDLATQFRSAPLSDEIANAVDLLLAAGLEASADVAADADAAPAAVLGPVIRETTTNVLRHGGGKFARLTLTRVPDAWRYEISNDPSGVEITSDGSGLIGIGRRVHEADGTLEVQHTDDEFTIIVTVPEARP